MKEQFLSNMLVFTSRFYPDNYYQNLKILYSIFHIFIAWKYHKIFPTDILETKNDKSMFQY